MSNPGKAIAGLVITASGIIVSRLPIPGAAQYLGKMIALYGFSMFLEGVFGTPELNPQGSKIAVTSTQAALPVIYGERRVSHLVADVAAHGTNNSWLDTMAGVCIAGESGKGIEGIKNIYLYADETTSITPTNTNTNAAGHTTNIIAKYFKDPDWHYRYSIGKGSDTQVVDARMADIQPTRWDSVANFPNLQGRGIVTVYNGFFWDKDEEDNVWERGRPTDIQYKVRGALLYDPRYKTAGPDSDGWIWDRADNGSLISTDNHPGQNPALQILDLLTSRRYGLGIPYSSRGATWGTTDEINEQSFIDMAEHCDEPVTTTGLDPNVTVPRYTSNLILSTSDTHKSNIERLLGSCNGMLAYEGGTFKIIPRKVTTAATYEITEPEIIGEISMIRAGISVPNIITIRHPDEEDREVIRSWTWPYDAFDSSLNGFLEADNGIPNERVFDVPAVTSRIHAQHLAMLNLKEMREDVAIEVTCRESALQLSVGDVVNVTYDTAGFSQTPFWVTGMELKVDNTVTLQLKEYGASVYTLDPNEDIPTTPSTNLPDPFTVTAPTGVTADGAAGYHREGDNVFVPRVNITWTHSTDEFAHEEEFVYKKDTDSEWIFTGVVKKITDTATLLWEGNIEVGVAYDFGIVAWNRVGVRSAIAETASPVTIVDSTTIPDAPTDLLVTREPDGRFRVSWTEVDNPNIMYYQVRTGGTSWETATHLWNAGRSPQVAESSKVPTGRVKFWIKSYTRNKVFSTNFATFTYYNWPTVEDKMGIFRERIRKRKFGDADGMAVDVVSATAGDVLIYTEDGTIGEELLYRNTDIPMADLEPGEGASERNRIVYYVSLAHDEAWVVPSELIGYTIYTVRYVGGGLSVQGASIWDDNIELSSPTDAPPTTYAQNPGVEVDGDSLTASLLLVESKAATLVAQNEPFTTGGSNVLTEFNLVTGRAAVLTAELPAFDNSYSCEFSFTISGEPGVKYFMAVVLNIYKAGDKSSSLGRLLRGTLPEAGSGGTLSADVTGWTGNPGETGDYAEVEITSLSIPGDFSLAFTVDPLSWTSGAGLKYASMTPNDEKGKFEIELISP